MAFLQCFSRKDRRPLLALTLSSLCRKQSCMAAWRAVDDRRLQSAAKHGQSGDQIASALARSRAAVYSRAAKLGIAVRSDSSPLSHIWTPKEDQKLRDLSKQPLGAAEIASRLSRSVTAVYVRIAKLSLVLTAATRPAHRVMLPVHTLLCKFDRGASVNSLSKHYQVDHGTVLWRRHVQQKRISVLLH